MDKEYRWVLHKEFQEKLLRWKIDLISRRIYLGRRLALLLKDNPLENLSLKDLFEALVQSRDPARYAESEVKGDGSDWTEKELSLLGDMTFACEVTMYDNGLHHNPHVHSEPFKGYLLFMSGALFRNDHGNETADRKECVISGNLDTTAFQNLISRRLRPLLRFANKKAKQQRTKTVVTIPGLGCGQFAGDVGMTNNIPEELASAIANILKEDSQLFKNISCVRFDPFSSSLDNSEERIHGIDFRIRPLTKGNLGTPQLSSPTDLEEIKGEFKGHILSSVVAWDPVSWPGNDFYIGNRSTDDGVKAAATNLMEVVTGLSGAYNASSNEFHPKSYENDTWESLVKKFKIRLSTRNRIIKEK